MGGRPRFSRVELVAAAAVVAALGGVIALAVSGTGPAIERAHPNALRVQAQELDAPLLILQRSTSAAAWTRMRTGPGAVARRVDACQRPYQGRLLRTAPGTDGARLSALYRHGILLERAQAAVAPAGPELRVLARAWADMRLANPTLQRFVTALSTELRATLSAPSLDACAFARAIAIDGFSLTAAEQSSYGAIARRFWDRTRAARTAIAGFWRYVRGARIRGLHVWTTQQLRELANVPGEIR